ncbi:MAG: type II secretion system F family protein [Calditerrivibrio nitroreducens]|uniref:Type II secretion system F family protein n=1 Tax=Calditerrivibrio nitroreducens TaxID=477976 RepID=A0A2J6WKG2_9BACT|nr:MAG: type II secretion system F family protein [Calditerrivibrio nitroreducens]
MRFNYKGTNKKGELIKGIIDAPNIEEASIILYSQGIIPQIIRESSSLDLLTHKIEKFLSKYEKVKLEELIVFTRQFASLFTAGIPILTILRRLETQNYSKKMKETISTIIRDIEAGTPLSIAFRKHKDIFSDLYINMLRVGEEGGVLDIVLQRLALILETDLDTRNKIKNATRYPKLVISAIVIAFIILMTFVIPKFASLFSKFDAALPLPTRMLIFLNDFFHNFWWLILLIVLLIFIIYRKYKKTPQGKKKIDEYTLKIPIIGPLTHKIYLSRIARILGLLYKSGISIITSFEIVSEVTGNDVIKDELLIIKEKITRGATIHGSFEASKYFPPVVSDMISAGEDTGQLDEMLFKIADYYDGEVDYSIKTLSQAIEPILLLMIAAMVLILALGVFLPMWDMVKVFKQ